jgi:hypothetical protein
MAMPVAGARRWIAEMGENGLFGVHFNFAGPGWFAPVANIDAVFRHLSS